MTNPTEESSAVGEKTTAEMEAMMESIIEEKVQARLEPINREFQERLAKLESAAKENAHGSTETIEANKSSNKEGGDVEEGGAKRPGNSDNGKANVQSATGNSDGNGDPVQDRGTDESMRNGKDIKKELFVNSTHQLLFLDEIKVPDRKEPYKVNCWDRFLAFAVIAFQFGAYYVMTLVVDFERESNGWDSSTRGLEIESKYCHDPYQRWYNPNGDLYDKLTDGELINKENFLDLLKCSKYERVPMFDDNVQHDVTIFFGVILLCFFLLPDFFEVFVLFRCSGWRAKATSVLVFLKAFMAMYVASYGSIWDGGSLSILDQFFFLVGVAFVHDLDDKFGYMRGVLRRVDYPAARWKKCCCCCCCSLEIQFVLFVLIVYFGWLVMMVVLEMIAEFAYDDEKRREYDAYMNKMYWNRTDDDDS